MSRKLHIEYPGAMYHPPPPRLWRDERHEPRGPAWGYMSVKWIAQRLHMGSWTCVSNLLNEPLQRCPQAQEVLPLRQ